MKEKQYALMKIRPEAGELEAHTEDAELYLVYLGEYVEKALSLNPVRYILKTVGRGEMLAALSGFFGD